VTETRERPTIFALSSGAPPAAIGVIRVSGPEAGAAIIGLAGALPAPRHAVLRTLRDPGDGALLDRALVLWFPGPASATGEDIAEFHIHGGRAVADAVLAVLGRLAGLEPAEAGAFTRRAFFNGVLDLAEAEGLADLLAAETETQRRAAFAMAGGALSRKVEAWRADLVGLAAQIEAVLDFADEADVAVNEAALFAEAGRLSGEIAELLRAPPIERLRDGIRIVLAGPPNAGKSTLLNRLAEREAAIVTAEPGTTRDLIEVPIQRNGIAYLLIDSAGLRDAGGVVEAIGIARAREAMAIADIVLWLGEASEAPSFPSMLLLHPRADMPGRERAGDPAALAVSARTGLGLEDLWDRIERRARALLPREGEIAVNARQREALAAARAALTETGDGDLLFLAEAVRSARVALDRAVGKAGVEDMLDALFGRFCIGK
jgi:tRNA modification GTPase